MNILETLVADRKAKKVRQCEVAKHIGISNAMLCRIESKLSSPNLLYIQKYAEILGYEIRLLKK